MNEKFLRRLPLIIFAFIILSPMLKNSGGGFVFFVIIVIALIFAIKKGYIKLDILKIFNKSPHFEKWGDKLNNNNKNMNETINLDDLKTKGTLKSYLEG